MNYQQQLKRIKKVKELLIGKEPSALLICSSGRSVKSWDQHFEFRQNSDFFYLTGSVEQDLALLIYSDPAKSPVLFSLSRNKQLIIWEGDSPSMKNLASSLSCELVKSDNLEKAIFDRLKDTVNLYTHSTPNHLSDKIVAKLSGISLHRRYGYPYNIFSAERLIENLRLYKDATEVAALKSAIRVTHQGLMAGVEKIRPGIEEEEIRIAIDNCFRSNRAIPGFETIVGAGASAATLHYWRHNRKVKNGEAVLIDCGAEYKLYNGDITRCYPAGGKFAPVIEDLYQIVLEGQKGAIKAVKNNAKIETVYNACSKILVEGLIELKVLKGKASTLFNNKAFRPYFPHGIGHSLGIDVHDVGNLRGNNNAVLKSGMVFTIEPGLYFPKPVGKLPACGIRIEDNVLVTAKGSEVLSSFIPKELKDLK